MIKAGKKAQIKWHDGNWGFLDCGFSTNARSCGLIIGDEKPKRVRFGEAKDRIIAQVTHSKSPMGLVIEAPLSVCFNKAGNPSGRSLERESANGKRMTRYWHNGLGCAVMVAAMYLVREIWHAAPKIPVRLFEGFVSYRAGQTVHRTASRIVPAGDDRPRGRWHS